MDRDHREHGAKRGDLLDARFVVQVDLGVGDVQAAPSPTAVDRLVIAAQADGITIVITPDTAIRLANELTDAVDQLDRSDQP